MMRRLIISFFAWLSFSSGMKAYIHVDFDYEGAALAYGAYLTLAGAEGLNAENINDILDHYTSAEVAAAGIWLSKWLDRKALKDEGIFGKTENHYYKLILFMVTKRITPRMIRIGKELLRYPEQFLYWGPYLFKTCEDVMNLCAQFEAIVSNGKLSFSHVDFIQLNPALMEYFDLSKMGNVNWQEVWDRLTNFPAPSWEDFREDFKDLFSIVSPVNIAIAGEESIKGQASHIFDRFAESPNSIPELLNQVQDAFHEVTSGATIRSILEGTIGDLKESRAVERLFNLGNYNVGSYINDYISQLKGEYYTQQWFIYHYPPGCDPSDGGYAYYTQKYKIILTVRNTGEVRELYSENYDSRNGNIADFEIAFSQKKPQYSQNYGSTGVVSVQVDNKVYYNKAGISGTDINGRIIDYDALFDSKKNHEAAFEKEFEQRRKTLERDQEVDNPLLKVKYYIGKGDKSYYTVESAETVKNVGSASFTVSCHDEVELVNSSFNFKVNERYDSGKMKEYAYPKSDGNTNSEPEDITLWEQKIEQIEEKIRENEILISDYQEQINRIVAIADTTTNQGNIKNLSNQISEIRSQISILSQENKELQDQLKKIENVYNEYMIDYDENFQGDYRIPAVENELAGNFHIHWDTDGSWSGNTYTRLGHIVGMDNGVKFIAEIKEERGESRFLGIRFHRAIIGVEYRLVTYYDTSDIVDVVTFNDNMTDKEKADLINNRRNEIQQEYPACQVKVVKDEHQDPEKDTVESLHLLWMSDRVALARFIEYRLRQIDGQLAFIERNLFVKRNILDDFRKAFMQGVPRWRTSTPSGYALQRWLDIGNGRITTH